MKLTPQLAQYIIDYASRIIDYTVNIMNTDAVIIASTDASRIGETHMGARKVLVTGMPYIMSEEEAAQYPNVIPGISLPIRFQKTILGVVGVGAGTQAATIGRFLQSTTELLIEQVNLKESVNAEKQVRNEFLTHLLSEPWYNNEFYFNHQLQLHKFDKGQCYLVITVDFPESTLAVSGEESCDSNIVHYEKNLSHLMESIGLKLNSIQILLVYIPNTLTFLVPYSEEEQLSREAFQDKFIGKLDFVLSQTLGSGYRIGTGGFADDMTKIHREYQHAVSALQISALLSPLQKITTFRSTYFEYLLLSIPEKKRAHYWNSILGGLLSQDSEKNLWIQTLETFFDNDQCIQETANALYIHRNTLLFRLNRIGKITSFYPQRIKDAITLYTALTLWKLDQFPNDNS